MCSTLLLQRIEENIKNLSPKQLRLANYIEKNYASLAYITITDLALLAGVSETTVVRFVYQLGFSGFPAFKMELRKMIEKLSQPATVSNRYRIRQEEYKFPQDAAKAIFTLEMQVMEETFSMLNLNEFQTAIDMIHSAPKVLVVACGANVCLSQALGFGLQVIRPDVYIIEKFGLSETALIRSLPEETVSVVFNTPRYINETQEILVALKEKKTKVIGVSDSILSPITPFSDVFFQIPVKFVTFFDTNAAFMAFIHSIVFALQLKYKKITKDNLDEYSSFTSRHNFYVKEFLDYVDI